MQGGGAMLRRRSGSYTRKASGPCWGEVSPFPKTLDKASCVSIDDDEVCILAWDSVKDLSLFVLAN